MTDRTVKVSLTAQVTGYVAGMDAAAKKTRELGTEAEKLAQKKQAIQDFSQAAGVSLLAIGVAAAGFVGLAVSKFAEFDQAMSEVQASTHESASNMELLRAAALKAGADTVFSAKEAADAENELAKAGVSTADILGGGLSGALSLASAGSLDVADAATIAATAMTQFGLKGSDVPHIADLLAAGAGKAQGSVQDLAAALNQGGLVADQAGQNIEDTTGALAAFASAGLIGSDAGTSLKTMLLSLESPSAKASAVMSKYGIDIYDAQGHMMDFSGIAGELTSGLGNLSDEQRNSALATIFGTDAVRAASVLYEQGADGISTWTDKVNDSGYAAETARLKLDNLNGDLEFLSGSIDTALIQSGSAANEVLRSIVQSITGFVDGIGALPAPVLATGLVLAGLVAVVGILGGGFVTLVPKIAATKLAMGQLNITGMGLAKGFGKGGLLIAALAAVSAGLAEVGKTGSLTADELAQVNSAVKTDNLKLLNKEFIDGNGNAQQFSDALKSIASANFFESSNFAQGFNGAIDGLTGGALHLSDSINRTKGTFAELGDQLGTTAKTDLPAAAEQFKKYVALTDGSDESIRQLLESMKPYKASLIELGTAQGKTLTDTQLLNLAQGEGAVAAQTMRDQAASQAVSLDVLAGQAGDTRQAVSDLADEIKNFGSAQFDVENATNSFYDAFDALQKLLTDGKGSLDQTTQAGRDTSAALLDTATSTNDLAAATLAQGGSTESVQAILEAGRQKIIDTRVALGDTTEAAQAYADKLVATPAQVATQIVLNGVQLAQSQIDQMIANNSQRVIDIEVRATLPDLNGAVSGSGRPGMATGGAVDGPGTGTSDTAGLFALSKGEHVLTAHDVNMMGGQSAVYGFRAALKNKRGMAGGGEVAANYRYATPNASRSSSSVGSSGPNYFTGQLVTDSGYVVGVVQGELKKQESGARMDQRQSMRGY